jgi:hypothetical protein
LWIRSGWEIVSDELQVKEQSKQKRGGTSFLAVMDESAGSGRIASGDISARSKPDMRHST